MVSYPLSHEERTAFEPREKGLHSVTLAKITYVNDRIKTYRLIIKDKSGVQVCSSKPSPPPTICADCVGKFLPGQWLDVHVPGIKKAGGFTITSSPRNASPVAANIRAEDVESQPFIELAVQKSPDNPPAAWLWRPEEDIVGKDLTVRVGGSFVWPPPGVDASTIKRVVFIAGGVGINPLISILSYIRQEQPLLDVRFLYSTKISSKGAQQGEVLFLPRILNLLSTPSGAERQGKSRLELFLTGTWDGIGDFGSVLTQRIDEAALSRAIDSQEKRQSSIFYVCGPRDMTDSIVEHLRGQDNIAPEQVLCEKWW
ncbi:hypothetical protein CC78DRAFT_557164 [Lojkania enalia]|uniref:FAD-binding FR-type domain-containing protein n=1 Tax=Lojkania enalia TaxID=147567 RepID=A0A9P4NDB5_9PLEO|nr:hypothetical protein CC78DRAFT_557164 [Didymosphaeria enalia]